MRDAVRSIGAMAVLAILLTPATAPAATVDEFPVGETPVYGTVSGTFNNTLASDNVYESIREVIRGTGSLNYSWLEHRWTFNITAGASHQFRLEAYRPSNSDSDNFTFAYSLNGTTWTNMVTVSKSSDDNTDQTYSLPAGTSGTVYVRVVDTNRSRNRTSLDYIYVDRMLVRTTYNTAPTVSAGQDQAITLPAAASLDGTVSDDGLPNPPAAVTVTWSKVSGPGNVTFGNANAVDTTATFDTPGTYVLQLLASDSALQSTDTVTITVNSGSTITFVNNVLTYGSPGDLGTVIDPPGLYDVQNSYGMTKAAFQALNPQVVAFNGAPPPGTPMNSLVAYYTTSGTVTFTFGTSYNYGCYTSYGRGAFSGSSSQDAMSTAPVTNGGLTDWLDAAITTTGGQAVKALGFCACFRNDQAVDAGQAVFTLSDATTETVTLPALGYTNPLYVFIGYQAPAGKFITRVQASHTAAVGGAWVAVDDWSFVMAPVGSGNGTGLRGDYYDNMDLTGFVLARTDATVGFDWGSGSPDPAIGADTFSVRWTGQVQALYSETYTFYTYSDDGVRLWVNGQQLVNNWTDHGPTENSGTIALSAGVKYDITMEYYENGGGAVAQLSWSSPSTPKQIIPQTQLYPAAGDAIAPAAVTDLATSAPTASSITLSWTAPGDDGNTGTAASYDIRYSTSTINDANWAGATQVAGEPAPAAAGTSQNMIVGGLSGDTTYYFAIKTSDEVPNVSAISNCPSGMTSDTVAPAAVGNLACSSPTGNSITLTWTAPGDNGSSGTAAGYDIRYSTSAINDANWGSATQATGEPAPAAAGTNQSLTVSGLNSDTTYYFAIKTSDEVPNVSPISNVPSGRTLDVTPPAAVGNLAAGTPTTSSLTLTWTAPGDDGSTGTAGAYDIRYSTSTINDANWDSATQVTGEPAPAVAGTGQNMTVGGLNASTTYYFAMKTSDEVPNTSALSNVASGTTSGTSQPPVTVLHIGANVSGWRGGYNVSSSYCWLANWPNSNADATIAEFDRTALQDAINTIYSACHGWDAQVVVSQVNWDANQPPVGIGMVAGSADLDRGTVIWQSSNAYNAGNGNWTFNGTGYGDFAAAVNAGTASGRTVLATALPYATVWDTSLPAPCWNVVADVPESVINAYLQNGTALGLFASATTTTPLNIHANDQWSHQANIRVVIQQPPQTAPWIGLSTFLVSKTIALSSPTDSQVVNVNNAGTGTLNWTAAENPDVTWLSISGGSGTGNGSFTANFNVTGLTAGNTYTTTIRVAATGAGNTPQDINVKVQVVANVSPIIVLTPTSLGYDMAPTDSAQGQAVRVDNGGLGSLNWTAAESPDVSWLTLTGASGSAGQSFTATVNPSGLAPGNYSTSISVSAPGATNTPQAVPVSLVVREKDADINKANSYDDAWESGGSGWVQHCTDIRNTWSGKVDGFVVHIGDSITYAAPYGSWARYGQGKTTADTSICSWMHADVNGDGSNNTNSGWWLAYYDVPGRGGSYTAKSGIRADQYIAGNYSLPSTDQMFTSGYTNPDGKQYRDAMICVLMLGTNDAGAGRSATDVYNDLNTIITKMEAAKVIVALSTLPPRYGADATIQAYNTQIRSLAQAKKIPLIDYYQEVVRRRPNGTWMNTLISGDGVHPSADYGGSHADSDPYAGNGAALSNSGYLLRDWLSVQKVQEIKTKVLGTTTWNVSNTSQLMNAVASYANGDSIVIAAGTYNPTNRLYLNRGAVTVRGATGNRDDVVIAGPGMAVNAEPTEMFDVSSDDVTIRDLTIRDVYYHGVHMRGESDVDRTHLQNIHTLNCGERHFKGSWDAGQPGWIQDDILIENCLLEQTVPNTGHSDNDYIAGIDTMGVGNIIIRDNVMHGIKGPTGGGRAAIFIWHHNTNCTIERNRIYDCDRGISMGNPGWAGPGAASTGGIIRNNFVTRGVNIALELCFTDSMRVCYNSIYSDDAGYWRTVSIYDAAGIYVTNNLQISYNIIRGALNNGSAGSGNVTLTGNIIGPDAWTSWFVNPATADLHLTASATGAFNAGALLPDVPQDFDRQNRSSTPDLGADEY